VVVLTAMWAGVGCSAPSVDSAVTLAGLQTPAAAPIPESAFTAFESGQVRPLALSADGAYLNAANTPDNQVEIFGRSRQTAHADRIRSRWA